MVEASSVIRASQFLAVDAGFLEGNLEQLSNKFFERFSLSVAFKYFVYVGGLFPSRESDLVKTTVFWDYA